MNLVTAGESHGKALVAIIENLPANIAITADYIKYYLNLRASGYGRGGRQKIESNEISILSGIRNGYTTGAPIGLLIENNDYINWKEIMDVAKADMDSKKITKLRAGHADFAGVMKYNLQDARNILERASARESAIRVAAGSIARKFLEALNIQVCGYVRQVGNIIDNKHYIFRQIQKSRENTLFMLDTVLCNQAKNLIDNVKSSGDTVGGVIEIHVHNIKVGFGSCMTYAEKLDANLAREVMSVQSIKGVEFGEGFALAYKNGSAVHDVIGYKDNQFYRKSNHAGGIEGGMTNGEDIILRAVQKPLPTLRQPLTTIDIVTKQEEKSAVERADCCAIESCQIILESVICTHLAKVILQRLGGDRLEEVQERYEKLP